MPLTTASKTKKRPKILAHGPTVHAAKRARYEAKQERLRRQRRERKEEEESFPSSPSSSRQDSGGSDLARHRPRGAASRASWFAGREEYAAFLTLEDVRDIRRLREGKCDGAASVDEEGGRIARLRRVGGWIEPFFDLKETPPTNDDAMVGDDGDGGVVGEGERTFASEGTEAVRTMVRRCAARRRPSPTAADDAAESDAPRDVETPPPPRLLSILAKPAAFFDAPTRLLGDVEGRRFLDDDRSTNIPPFKIIVANEDALSEIAGFRMARGAMACGVVPDHMRNNGYAWLKRLLCGESHEAPATTTNAPNATRRQRGPHDPRSRGPVRRLLALDAVSNAANVGSIIRTAAAFSIDAIILSDDSCDAWYRQSVRVSMGHVIDVPTLRVADWERGRANSGDGIENGDDGRNRECGKGGGLAGVLRWLREETDAECLAAVVDDDDDSKSLPPLVTLEDYEGRDGRSWCCVLGNEGHGIRDEVISECEGRIKIGMAGGVDSLSLPIAAGILMHGLSSVRS